MAESRGNSGHGISWGNSYWEESTRPLTSLVFITPLLAAYELGILWLGPAAVHNGAAVWLKRLLALVGFGQYFLAPVLVCAILLSWHHLTRQKWRISVRVVALMALETGVLAFMLLGLARLQAQVFGQLHLAIPCAISARDLVSYCGAGIYEELLFRLMLLPTVAGLLRLSGISQGRCFAAAALITSLIFSLAHYRLVVGSGDEWQWFSFVFRFLAGTLFAMLFLFRGFGIAAGSHALYDCLAALVK